MKTTPLTLSAILLCLSVNGLIVQDNGLIDAINQTINISEFLSLHKWTALSEEFGSYINLSEGETEEYGIYFGNTTYELMFSEEGSDFINITAFIKHFPQIYKYVLGVSNISNTLTEHGVKAYTGVTDVSPFALGLDLGTELEWCHDSYNTWYSSVPQSNNGSFMAFQMVINAQNKSVEVCVDGECAGCSGYTIDLRGMRYFFTYGDVGRYLKNLTIIHERQDFNFTTEIGPPRPVPVQQQPQSSSSDGGGGGKSKSKKRGGGGGGSYQKPVPKIEETPWTILHPKAEPPKFFNVTVEEPCYCIKSNRSDTSTPQTTVRI